MINLENSDRKVLILGIDGVPYSFIKQLIKENKLPNFKKLFETGSASPLKSILPTVSGVAWTAIFTGVNPAKFDVFGFLDLKKDYTPFIPTSTNLKSDNILDFLSQKGKRVISLGVPMTYPPKEVNGICVGGFLTPSLEKGIYPKEMMSLFKEEKYIVDINPMKARESLEFFMEELSRVFEGRKNTMLRLMKEKHWDFFITHFIDTDRINHFLWHYYENGSSKYKDFFLEFYQKIDALLGTILDVIDENTTLIVLSDHGFCKTKKEIQLNFWLKENGYLKFINENPKSFKDIHEASLAFSLTPGRIYIHTKKWKNGKVLENESKGIINEIIDKLSSIQNPENNEKIFNNVYKKDEIYSGKYIDDAPEITILPNDGYELKAKLDAKSLFNPPDMAGIHTYEDAMIAFNEKFDIKSEISVLDVYPTILEILGLEGPDNLDGSSIINK
ncbi:MAG: alkaline phosphatase family protein [Promethearchaeota archaeon]